MDERKGMAWLMIAVGVFFIVVGIGVGVEKYQLNQCRIAMKDRPVEQINAVCK